MKIGGFQKLSLVDYPGHPCSIIFTQGCVFRCGYCHNPSLIPLDRPGRFTPEEILEQLDAHRAVVSAVCVTGGEPTIHPGLLPFLREIKKIGIRIKLDTNGIRPDVVRRAIDENLLDYIAMDLKAPWEKYPQVIGEDRGGLVDACKRTFSIIQESSIDHEFRTTIHPGVHTAEDLSVMTSYLKHGERYFIQETSFQNVLDTNLSRSLQFHPQDVVRALTHSHPSLTIELR